jgi:hypothetical protein
VKAIRLAVIFLLLRALSNPIHAAAVFTINSGPSSLTILSNGGAYGVAIQLTNGAAVYQQTNSMAVEVVNSGGAATWLAAPYSTVVSLGAGVYQCDGVIASPNGSVFHFTDLFKAYDATGAFEVDRSVQVGAAGPNDAGFSTKLTFQRSVTGRMTDYDFFMPSIWYRTNEWVNSVALANTMTDYYYWYREDRMPLPLFMLREKDNGATFSVTHQNPDGGTFVGEDYLNRIIDGRMLFASLGMENNTQPSVGMLFPGTEGERTLILGGSTGTNWALRSHPITAGFKQTYSLVARLTTEPDFPTALEHTWTAAYVQFNPPIYPCDLSRIYSNAIHVLSRYWRSINSAGGEPFRVPWPSGVVTNQLDYNYDMGFVGMQLPNAAILIREGFNTTNSSMRSEGEQMAEWWAGNSLTSAGCPKTWYDPYPQTWRTYTTYLRVSCDGMIGLLWAWNQERIHGISKTNWLCACERFGDWLIGWQNHDGSIPRGFDYSSNQSSDPSLDNTSHMIRFLAELYLATGSTRYKQAALNAGGYIYTNVYQNFSYVGGAVDNPNVPDKEAASMALRAFTALYDLTRDNRWMAAATRTAYYYATWIYSWNIPIPSGDPGVVYPLSRSTTGLSVIATSNSGCDSYAATDAFELYRLYLFTGDTNLLSEARMMLYNSKQPLDWDSTNPLGYGDPGIFPESLSLTPPRGHGVSYYLPWQTANYMEPMVNLFDAFGSCSIDAIEQQSLSDRQAKNIVYANNRGYAASQLILSAMPTNGQVALDWTPGANAASYEVRRAAVSGGPYAAIASVTAPGFTDSNVVNEATYYYVVSAIDGAGGVEATSGEVRATPADALTALYPFDGDTLDASGAGNDGTNHGAVFVPGIIGPLAAQFNGGGYVLIPLSIGNASFTIALWVKTTDTGGAGANWYEGEGLVDAEVGGVTNDFGTALLNGKFALGIGNPDTTLVSTRSINDGNWHHVAAIWNIASGAAELYVDGVADTSGAAPTGPRTAPTSIQIGHDPTGAYLKGTIDDVRLFGRVLSGSEIAALASAPPAPSGLSATANGVQVTLNWTGAAGMTGYNLKRSTTDGGPYRVIAGGIAATNYVDAGLVAGVTDYYVVSGVSGFYESANSAVAYATPQGLPPLGVNPAAGGGQLLVSWPGWATGFRLYTASNLTPPVLWTPNTNPVGNSNGQFRLALPLGSEMEFLRLRSLGNPP